ncbi:hypothetical protein [Gemmatimonas sp.]|uniref:hypothetical protein n=1 Tax=Gemmatimonas sp. TaxID=1962908 RepID=UPI0035631D63
MDGLEWIFDPVPPSGALSGGDPASYVFKPSIDTFVREVVQNSNDQRGGEGMVDVTFALHEFTGGDAADTALSAVGWNQLVTHLEAVSETESLIAGRVREAVDDASQGRLLMLAVSDRNTRGLYGEEMSTDGNFAPLCRHKLVTSDDKTLGGGSHGLGKAVLWSFSSISTVAFASVIDDDPGQTRYIARTELPYHDHAGTVWAGQGWYGVP